MENKEAKNSYVAITGASSGIGYDAAKAFAGRHKNLIIIARRKENLEKLREEILKISPSIDVVIKLADLSDMENVYKLYESLKTYHIDTWINNAGLGNYGTVAEQSIEMTSTMLRVNIEALTILSALYVKDYKDVDGTQLINVSSGAGYIVVGGVVAYSATKFYVSAFTEGLARELQADKSKLQAKVLAPAATETEFGAVATNAEAYDYEKNFSRYHTSEQMAGFLLDLYDSSETVGIVDLADFKFKLMSPKFQYEG